MSMSQSLPALQCSTVCSGQAAAGLHASCQRHCSSGQQGSAAHPAQLTAAHRHGWQHCRRHTEAHNPLSVLLSVSQQLRHTQHFTAYCSKAPLKAARSPATRLVPLPSLSVCFLNQSSRKMTIKACVRSEHTFRHSSTLPHTLVHQGTAAHKNPTLVAAVTCESKHS